MKNREEKTKFTCNVERKVLLNPGPSTTTDSVKMAQIVSDICPREKEFANLMKSLRDDLPKIVHAPSKDFTCVLFCGSGTINIDVCINSLLPEGKKVLIVNNGSYSQRAVEICQYYNLPFINLQFEENSLPDLNKIRKVMDENPDIALVHTTHNETGTGLCNPIREIGKIVHNHNAVFTCDTTSSLAMIPIDMVKDNLDFCMASAQKGIMGMAGLSFIIGRKDIIEKSASYPKRSYYCNLFLQYDYFEKTGQMHFTPPVQTVYAARQALDEYFEEGEKAKWERHTRVFNKIHENLSILGFKDYIPIENQSGLVCAELYPDDPAWDFSKIHDYCYAKGFTIYPGKISKTDTFRLCALGAIDEKDIDDFFVVFKEALKECGVKVPVIYKN